MKTVTNLVSKQLQEADWVDKAVYDIESNTYFLEKRKDVVIEKGKIYIIEVDDSILTKGKDPVLESNWNNGFVPAAKYFTADVLNIVGKMVYIFGRAYDPETKQDTDLWWQGYLPKDKIKILETL